MALPVLQEQTAGMLGCPLPASTCWVPCPCDGGTAAPTDAAVVPSPAVTPPLWCHSARSEAKIKQLIAHLRETTGLANQWQSLQF